MANAGLAKALVLNTQTSERIEVMYNPEEFKLDEGNNFAEVGIPGLDVSPVQYVRGKARTLSMDLFFDSYELRDELGQEIDVRSYSDRVVRLLDKLPQTHAPPVLVFSLGQFQFQCVLVDANQRFTMFAGDGTPMRVTMSVRFQEFVRVEVAVERGLFLGPPTLQTAIRGQTLSGLAAKFLGDPFRWREIAQANNIDDPFGVPPGTPLVIPPAPRSAPVPGGPRP